MYGGTWWCSQVLCLQLFFVNMPKSFSSCYARSLSACLRATHGHHTSCQHWVWKTCFPRQITCITINWMYRTVKQRERERQHKPTLWICSTVLANLHTWQRNQLQQTLIKKPWIVATHFLTISVLDSDLPRGGRACCGGLLPILWYVEAGAEMDRSKGTPAPVTENKNKYRWTGGYSTGLEISCFLWNPKVLLCPQRPTTRPYSVSAEYSPQLHSHGLDKDLEIASSDLRWGFLSTGIYHKEDYKGHTKHNKASKAEV
jgi:hypothetical protein